MTRELELKKFISLVLESSAIDDHRCLNGDIVPVESETCFHDVNARIEDAQASRDQCSLRTDEREHYNGLLKILRRKLRRAKKFVV